MVIFTIVASFLLKKHTENMKKIMWSKESIYWIDSKEFFYIKM